MILGHERQKEYFNRALKNGRLAHAYLLHGPEYVGKFSFAKAAAKLFFCEEHPAALEEVCDSCSSCRLIEENTHPEVTVLDRAHTLVSKKEARKEIPIEDIRELKRRFSLASVGSRWKIAIINDADSLSEEAGNSLLKLLEEPGEQTIFFIVTAEKDSLLPTIVSRSVPLRFSLVSQKTMQEFLAPRAKNPALAEEIISLSFGKPGLMLLFLKEPSLLLEERKFCRSLDAALRGGVPEILRFTEKIAPDENLRKKAGEYLLSRLRELVLRQKSGNRGLAASIQSVQRIFSLASSTNVNPRLALEVMLLEGKSAWERA